MLCIICCEGRGGDAILLRVPRPNHDQPLLRVQLRECEPPVPHPPAGDQLLLRPGHNQALVVRPAWPPEPQHRHPGVRYYIRYNNTISGHPGQTEPQQEEEGRGDARHRGHHLQPLLAPIPGKLSSFQDR